jgi:hypothetical protein
MPSTCSTPREAIVFSLCMSLFGCAGSHGTETRDAQVDAAHPDDDAGVAAADASSGDDAQASVNAAEAGASVSDAGTQTASPIDAASDACADNAAADAACPSASAPGSAPDCSSAGCTGELRWRKQLSDDDADAGAPRFQLTHVVADRGVVALVEGGRGTRFDGVALLEDAELDPTTQRGIAIVRLDAQGKLVDRRVLPPVMRPDGGPIGNYNAAGHAESLLVITEYAQGVETRSLAWVQGTPGVSRFAWPADAERVAIGRERWVSFASPADTAPAACAGGAGKLTRLERQDLSGQRVLARGCARTAGTLHPLVVLPSGGAAAIVAPIWGEEGKPEPDRRSDFGAGPVQLAPGQAYLVAWNADGSQRFVRSLERLNGHPHVGGDDFFWVLETTARTTAPYRCFDRHGVLQAEGMTPERSNWLWMHIDAAGYALMFGSTARAGEVALRKLTPQSEPVWERVIEEGVSRELASDAAGNIYLVNGAESAILQLAP